MECQNITKTLKINLKKNIGTVILIVEGNDYEFKLFYQIFHSILHYTLISKSRMQKKVREYCEFSMKGNEASKVIIFNTRNSNIGSIKDDTHYRDELYKLMYEKYGIDTTKGRVYYIWDRDNESNDANVTKKLLNTLTNPYENDNFESGLLLLSYPCCEAYTISNFESKKSIKTNIKKYVQKKEYGVSSLSKETIQKAVLEMQKKLKSVGVNEINLDKIQNINLKCFDFEENYFVNNSTYFLLSLISIVLLDLQIITFNK